ncbi:T9SS type B sorting domain-containing protein [Algibacter sp. 2305UL17-15]|uniref:T9SS type B sorting domain-containing protein n=1 Tax=Algibacter sp. 2305UL17-15 TaxID=3231268 RepID=UPI0034585462
MFNRPLIFFFIFSIHNICVSQNTFVPDDNFEQELIRLGYDVGPLDDFVPTVNINAVTSLVVSKLNINDLTGIEDFTALEVLDCSENKLTHLDVSKNLNLEQLFCAFNTISSLDVSNNTSLKILWCNFNKLTNLDLSKNAGLLSLICSNNSISTIDVSKNLVLNTFICVDNGITNLNVSVNSQLKIFHCGNNKLTTIDVSQNPLLEIFNCEYNALENLDVSQNKNLSQLFCLSNKLTSIAVSNNKALSILSCGNNQLSDLNVAQNLNLTELYCHDNLLESLNLSANSLLTTVDCRNNNLCLLNLQNKNNTNMVTMDARGNMDLSCIFVDDAGYSNSNWIHIEPTSNFVNTQQDCEIFADIPDVTVLDDFIGSQYVLPSITDGSYFTQSEGNGQQLFPGHILSNSQTIYIYISSGCYSNESSFNIIISDKTHAIPKYFTPNNDTVNDFWQVIDPDNTVNNITIYNRQGKLLKLLDPKSQGWDGTFNGNQLPTDTYWYEIVLNSREIIRGYFALKR